METIIALWCANKHVHNFRTRALYEYLCENHANNAINVICSGGPTNGKIIPESTIMREKLEKLGLNNACPHATIYEESLSTDTAKNIRNSLLLILEKKLILPKQQIITPEKKLILPKQQIILPEQNLNSPKITIKFLTSGFHIQRTQDFAEYIIEDEFPEYHGTQIEMISAEDYATEQQKSRLLVHPAWQGMHEEFLTNEKRGLAKKVEEREYNRPPHRLLNIK